MPAGLLTERGIIAVAFFECEKLEALAVQKTEVESNHSTQATSFLLSLVTRMYKPRCGRIGCVFSLNT